MTHSENCQHNLPLALFIYHPCYVHVQYTNDLLAKLNKTVK